MRAKQARSIASGIVSKANLSAIPRELKRRRLANGEIADHLGVHNLAKHTLVAASDHEAVPRRIVLVLVLNYQAAASLVVSLALTPPAELHLEALVVSRRLEHLDITH